MTDNVQLLKEMDARGADLNAQYPERFNWTPLITAIYFENTNAIAYLVSRGVDVSKRDGTGETALMWAIRFDDTNTATLLFQKSPQAIREGEDWLTVRSLIQAPPRDQASRNCWNTLIDEFLRTNASAVARP
jgi:ankyrin repeat protein